jgi:8-oxo-dGTP diphosphatase
VYLVRHAQALARHEWDGADELRPLSPKGERQARGLVELLGRAAIMQAFTSPAVRCNLTVAPLADKLGVDLETAVALFEGRPAEPVIDLMRTVVAAGGGLLCSHGDVIPDVLRHLAAAGVTVDGPLKWAKGSVWAVDHDGSRFTTARYMPPPEL